MKLKMTERMTKVLHMAQHHKVWACVKKGGKPQKKKRFCVYRHIVISHSQYWDLLKELRLSLVAGFCLHMHFSRLLYTHHFQVLIWNYICSAEWGPERIWRGSVYNLAYRLYKLHSVKKLNNIQCQCDTARKCWPLIEKFIMSPL